ncbi:S53 family peptidase [Dyella psychrodurans]|nr:S53 family peptidase [Dyella psychrodurans]
MFLLTGLLMTATPLMAQESANATPDTTVKTADDSENVQFALILKLRNQDELRRELKNVYNPLNPNYHAFLSAADFQSEFAPSADDYSALKAFAAKHGLHIVHEHAGHTMLSVSGSAATVRDLFKTHMVWRQSREGKQYLAADAAPTAPSELSSLGGSIVGLNQTPLRPFAVPTHRTANSKPSAGSGPDGFYTPADIRTTYNLNGMENGGEPVALVEFSSANYSDAAVYANTYKLPNPALTQIAVDGGNTDTTNAFEVMLDIEMVMAISSPSNIYVYTAPNTVASGMDTFLRIAEDDQVGQVSTSWGVCEAEVSQDTVDIQNQIFMQLAAEGIAVFAATGDYGYNGCQGTSAGVADPASQPYVTGVGATTLTTSSSQAYEGESVWYNANASPYPSGSGGGVSMYWPIPDYQTGVKAASSQFSRTMRNVPDVSADGDPDTGFYVYCSQCNGSGGAGWGGWGGTSVAAPQWAALWSLIGKAMSNGVPVRVGFANPALYSIGESGAGYVSAMHDVITGNNGYYDAVIGYDNATGWGSYNGAGLLQQVKTWKRKRTTIAPVIHYILSHNQSG